MREMSPVHAQRSRFTAIAFALGIACACTGRAGPGEWPVKPVRLIVPFGAGASSDLAARLFAPRLAERWRRSVVIDNRPGGDAVAGVQAFVAATDHHTLLFAPTGVVTTAPLLHDPLPSNPVGDLVPIAAAGRPSIGIAAASSAPIHSLAELVALVRRRPREYLWAATPGLPELVFQSFLELEQLQMKHVAYRDIVAGRARPRRRARARDGCGASNDQLAPARRGRHGCLPSRTARASRLRRTCRRRRKPATRR